MSAPHEARLAGDDVAVPLDALGEWRMAGRGSFRPVGPGVVESEGGPGILWYPQVLAGYAGGDELIGGALRRLRLGEQSYHGFHRPPPVRGRFGLARSESCRARLRPGTALHFLQAAT